MERRTVEAVERERERERERDTYNLVNKKYINKRKGNIIIFGDYYDTG